MHTVKKFQIYNVLGQTILEVLVALTLIVLFLTGVLVIQLYSVRNINYAQNKSVATKLARQQLDRVKVVRDSAGIGSLTVCLSSCYINNQLTPIPVTPTGTYGQKLVMQLTTLSDCPLPAITITPAPVSYKVTSTVDWSAGAPITPAAQVQVTSCVTDWR